MKAVLLRTNAEGDAARYVTDGAAGRVLVGHDAESVSSKHDGERVLFKDSDAPVLVLDGHTNQGLACVRALGEAGRRVFVASHQRLALGTWSRYCRGSFRLKGQTAEAFDALRAWARARGVRVVLPLTERACVLLNAARGKWEAEGIKVGCGTDEMLASAFDKARTIRAAEACGVRVPATRFPASLEECFEAAEELGFPVVVKPRRSNAWDGSRFLPVLAPAYVRGREELAKAVEARRQRDEWPLLQGFVRGRGKGVFALCERGRALAWFAHERLRDTQPTGSSSSLRRSVALDTRLREPAERLLSEMNWHGPAMVEFKDDERGEPCLMEVNGRFWGSLQLGVDAGVNFPLMWLSVLEGGRVKPSEVYAEGVTVRWLWGDVKRFLRILAGAPRGYPGAYPSVRQGLRELLGPQPEGTRLEVWRARDPWPAVGEFVQGARELFARL
ncbi:MAG TPA: ATP-grasp domain-containing protein [Pyrinomonadaceae bacterium]|nr:ATP-grasp domain-containing protein [Pyrinomonadaceae bacterium]